MENVEASFINKKKVKQSQTLAKDTTITYVCQQSTVIFTETIIIVPHNITGIQSILIAN